MRMTENESRVRDGLTSVSEHHFQCSNICVLQSYWTNAIERRGFSKVIFLLYFDCLNNIHSQRENTFTHVCWIVRLQATSKHTVL